MWIENTEAWAKIEKLSYLAPPTLFDYVSPREVFDETLQRHFAGARDPNTLRILGC